MTPSANNPPDASAAHRLPYTVEPRRYELHLTPNLETATFAGEVTLYALAHEATSRVVLHAAELAIREATAAIGGPGNTPEHWVKGVASLDEKTERLTVEFPTPFPAGPLTLRVGFTGVLNDHLHGFYRSIYQDDEGSHTLATTQFEATDARRAFPCLDEPDRKAVFAVTLDVPEGLAAFSNGPVIEETPLPAGGRRVRFGDTIPMSTYLVAFVVGRLEASEPVDVDGVPVRVVHVPGKGHLSAFALEVAAHALRFFTEWFDLPYPAEKLDLLAIPDFAFGAMENLGCVTFRESALLVNPDEASRLELERVADVVSHEIAHMWFGDLVTMKWWEGIWLNEAFATLMELLAVDHFRPEWHRWTSFGVEREGAMAVDALHATRPVEYPVGPPEEAQGMFDVLTYQKGGSVLRMLERYLGTERFRDGIRRYLATHRLGNTETADLWDAIEAASGEPVRSIMDTWILQGGFPLVELHTGPSGATLTQTPFAYASPEAGRPSAQGSRWQVPVIARTVTSRQGGEVGAERRVLLEDNGEPFALDIPLSAHAPVVLNAAGSGFYRVRYPAEHLDRLAAHIEDLDPLERFNLLGDTWAAVLAGRAALDDHLRLAEALATSKERDPDVWSQATSVLGFLDRTAPESARPTLAAYTRDLLGPVFAELGWQSAEGETDRTATLRAQLLSSLGITGNDTDLQAQCIARHSAATSGGAPLDPDLAGAVVGVVAAAGGTVAFDLFLDRYRHPATPQEESRYLYALAGFEDPLLAERAFTLAITEVRTQNAPFLIQLLLANRATGEETWKRVVEHWEALVERFPANILPRMLDGVKFLCREPELASSVRSFLAEHPMPSGQRTVDQTSERLGINTAFATRLAPEVEHTLAAARARWKSASGTGNSSLAN
jgi:puromycin-sensitive aminopeptidase